jgi:hypothetical protein
VQVCLGNKKAVQITICSILTVLFYFDGKKGGFDLEKSPTLLIQGQGN